MIKHNKSDEAARRMLKARSYLVASSPFFGVLALQLEIIEDSERIPTMATDGRRILYNIDWIMPLSDAELTGVWVHEIFHICLGHHYRRVKRDPRAWNYACDFAIDPDILSCGYSLPYGGHVNHQYRGMSAEEIYATIPEVPVTFINYGDVLDAADPDDKTALEKARIESDTMVRQAVMAARMTGEGRLPATLARMINAMGKGKISWKEILRRFADEAIVSDYAWSRPNRRHIGNGLILPSIVKTNPNHIVAVVDTSGSMDNESLRKLISEIQSILDEEASEKVTIVYCDQQVHKIDIYETGDIIKPDPVGGGGTDFAPAFQWIADNANDVTGILYMTDLECSSWGEAPGVPVLWCVIQGGYHRHKVPFGEVISVDPHA